MKLRTFISMGLALFSANALCTVEYTYEDLGVVTGYSINDSGTVAGAYAYTAGGAPYHDHAFVCATSFTDLGTLSGGTHSDASSINNAGVVSGWADTSGGNTHPVVWSSGGTISDVAPASGDYATGTINNLGQFGFMGGAYPYHPYIYSTSSGTSSIISGLTSYATPMIINSSGEVLVNGIYGSGAGIFVGGTGYALSTLGGQFHPYAMNTLGAVAGSSQNSSGSWTHACVWYPDTPNATSGSCVDLGLLGTGANAVSHGINAWGVVVGYSEIDTMGDQHGFRYKNGTMEDLNNLVTLPTGDVIVNGVAINNRYKEQILANVYCTDGKYHTFRLTLS